MTKNQLTQAEYSKGAKTPEERFDRQFLSGNYMMFLIVALFLVVGVECYIGLMPRDAVIGVAAMIGSFASYFLAAPLLWEMDGNNHNRLVRRVRRTIYFPISIRNFVFSKIKLMSSYGSILWLVSLVIQLVFTPLFGFGNLWLYQTVLAVAFLVNMLISIGIGTIGVRFGR